MTPEEAKEFYGEETYEAMKESGWLSGITVTMTEDGEMDIPKSDLDRAYRAVQGEEIGAWEWD